MRSGSVQAERLRRRGHGLFPMRASGCMGSAPSPVLAVVATAVVALVACGSQAGSLGEVGTYVDGGAGTSSGFASGADARAKVESSPDPTPRAPRPPK